MASRLKAKVLGENLPSVAGAMMGIENTYAAYVVKIAECVEAATYYFRYAHDVPQRSEVQAYLTTQLWKTLSEAVKRYPTVPFDPRAADWIQEALIKL